MGRRVREHKEGVRKMGGAHRKREFVGRRMMVGLLVLAFVLAATLVGCENDDDEDVKTVVGDDGTVITRYPDGTVETNDADDFTTDGLVIYQTPTPTAGWIYVDANEYASTNFAGYEFEGEAFTSCADFQTYLDTTHSNLQHVLINCVDPTNDGITTSSP